jgi:Tfp pilus assembly protein PilV
MDTFSASLRHRYRSSRGGAAVGEDGFMLLEVVITALLVGLITVATLTGFDAVDRNTAAQRQHDEASFLAAASQEQLRSDPASALETLELSPHQFTQTSGGNTYTITQHTKILGAGESSAACSVVQKNRQSANAIRVTSTVTWKEQELGHRPAVVEAGVITPPVGSGLEIDAANAPNPTAGVSGVTAEVQYTASKGGSAATVEQTTGVEGCVIFTGIPATTATVKIRELLGYVTTAGETAYPAKEVTLAPNYTTHDQVTYNQGGAISAQFAYKGATHFTHLNNEGKTPEINEEVKGDTFVAANSLINANPDFEVGSTRSQLGTGGVYEVLPSTYGSEATSPKESAKYPSGNLFPFLEKKITGGKSEGENSWTVYAGDCSLNEPEVITSKAVKVSENVTVHPATTTTVQVPMSYVTFNLYSGTEAQAKAKAHLWEALETATSYPVTITNTKCAGVTPNNEAAIKDEHTQSTTTEATLPHYGGHLEDPFQPFGSYSLCVFKKIGSSGTTYTTASNYENKATPGATVNIYLGQSAGTSGGVTVVTGQTKCP